MTVKKKHENLIWSYLPPSVLTAAVVSVFLLAGCKKQTYDDAGFRLYYPDKDNVKVASVGYETKGEDALALVNEVLDKLRQQPADFDLRPAIPEDIPVRSVGLNDGLLVIDFGTEYLRTEGREEILRRAALVRTLDQIDGVDEIMFTVDETALTDTKGNPVGMMTADMFIDNAGNEINAYERTRLVLYYADEAGTGLVKTTEAVAYNSNISMEKLVSEHLIQGPLSNGVYPVADPLVHIISVTTKDGICYVNLSKEFLVKQGKLTDEVALYAFVNSLTELPNINKVQFMIDSETEISFGDHSYLNEPFERNLEIVDGK